MPITSFPELDRFSFPSERKTQNYLITSVWFLILHFQFQHEEVKQIKFGLKKYSDQAECCVAGSGSVHSKWWGDDRPVYYQLFISYCPSYFITYSVQPTDLFVPCHWTSKLTYRQIKSSLFGDVAQRWSVVSYGHFDTTCHSRPKG
jgi:hypothetical protein